MKTTNALITTAFTTWRKKLLDITKHNKALNYRPARVASVEIVDEKPAIVFKYLLQGKKMKFYPVLPSTLKSCNQAVSRDSEQECADNSRILSVTFDIDDTAPSSEFTPYAINELEERHTDNFLQCYSSAERLDISLRRLNELARLTISEQGVNTLFLALGFIHFKENDQSNETIKAPVVLFPVKLERETARSAFVITATEEEPIINPTLTEYLRQHYGFILPRLPDQYESYSFDLQEYFKEVIQVFPDNKNWSLRDDICLAQFAFHNFTMYKDLEKNEHVFSSHRLIKQLMTKTSHGGGTGLPVNIKNIDLDSEFCPEDTYLVMDADSSQLRCIAAVTKGYDLVIEGPPGSGKSQTITNLISSALSQNKTVLFVSEKSAALQVVYRRLQEAGLDEFCLELHSTKVNRKQVLEDLKRSIENPSLDLSVNKELSMKIKSCRKQLTDYVKVMHSKISPMSLSPFEVLELYVEVESEKSIICPIDVLNITNNDVGVLFEILENVSIAAQPLGEISKHPWRDSVKTYITRSEIDTIGNECKRLLETITLLNEKIELLSTSFDMERISSLNQVDKLIMLSECLSNAPGVPCETLQNDIWDSLPQEVESILQIGENLSTMYAKLHTRYYPEIFESYHGYDIEYIQTKTSGFKKLFRIFDERYRGIKRKWRSYQKRKLTGSIASIAEDLRLADKCSCERLHIESASPKFAKELGVHWKGINTDWAEFRYICLWITQFRLLANSMHFGVKTFTLAAAGSVDTSIFDEICMTGKEINSRLVSLQKMVGWDESYLTNEPINKIVERLEELYHNLDRASQWAVFQNTIKRARNSSVAFCVTLAERGDIPFIGLKNIFKRSFYQKWLDTVIGENPLLREFSTIMHEQCLEQFRKLDVEIQQENRVTLVSHLRESVQNRIKSLDVQRGMQFLKREFSKKIRLSPLRKTMQVAEAAVRAIKPCFLMSPISVAQYLDASLPMFDLVIFDEASQVPTENAIGSMCRGKQLVVVGDPKQLPPTNFFTSQAGQISDNQITIETTIETAESVLDEFLGSGLLSSRLRWHYRSAHESLITFSNISFYNSDLITFPSVKTANGPDGLQFTYISDGCYEGKGLNRIEANRVADAIIEHAKKYPDISLGVGTFSLHQQIAILDELETRRRKDPSVEEFFLQQKPESFFVKNIENIQGDERDVIFISITYGKDKRGILRCNFGPVNNENGWRRLNVLITRARKQMRVFSSMHGEEINPLSEMSRGPLLLRDFLIYAEHGRMDIKKQVRDASLTSFEQDIMNELECRGYEIDPQVGASGYKIDLGVRHPSFPGRYICGIVCDGIAYHLSETARDRDRLKAQVLDKLGWELINVWSVDWYKERKEHIEHIVGKIENIRNKLLLIPPETV